jgi:hypothetical protein
MSRLDINPVGNGFLDLAGNSRLLFLRSKTRLIPGLVLDAATKGVFNYLGHARENVSRLAIDGLAVMNIDRPDRHVIWVKEDVKPVIDSYMTSSENSKNLIRDRRLQSGEKDERRVCSAPSLRARFKRGRKSKMGHPLFTVYHTEIASRSAGYSRTDLGTRMP